MPSTAAVVQPPRLGGCCAIASAGWAVPEPLVVAARRVGEQLLLFTVSTEAATNDRFDSDARARAAESGGWIS